MSAMTTTATSTTREVLVAAAEANGWVLDPAYTRDFQARRGISNVYAELNAAGGIKYAYAKVGTVYADKLSGRDLRGQLVAIMEAPEPVEAPAPVDQDVEYDVTTDDDATVLTIRKATYMRGGVVGRRRILVGVEDVVTLDREEARIAVAEIVEELATFTDVQHIRIARRFGVDREVAAQLVAKLVSALV
jgi:hypothetical protein